MHPSHPQNYESIRFIILVLKNEMIRMEAEMSAYNSKNFSELSALLSAVKDIGSATVAVLLAEVPELKMLSRCEISALIGGSSKQGFRHNARLPNGIWRVSLLPNNSLYVCPGRDEAQPSN